MKRRERGAEGKDCPRDQENVTPLACWAGLTLPIALAPFGAPGCSWSVSIDVAYPLAVTPVLGIGIAYSPTFTIPNVPALAGQTFYDQAFFRDPAANPWGVVPVAATAWKMGSNRGAPGAMVQYTGPGTAAVPSGNAGGFAFTIRLQ